MIQWEQMKHSFITLATIVGLVAESNILVDYVTWKCSTISKSARLKRSNTMCG